MTGHFVDQMENTLLTPGLATNPQYLFATKLNVTAQESEKSSTKSCTFCWLHAQLALQSWQTLFVDTVPSPPRTGTGALCLTDLNGTTKTTWRMH